MFCVNISCNVDTLGAVGALLRVGILLRVAFFTLIERKVIGLIHYRVGPNKVVRWGVSQPIADALKLLTKEYQKFTISRLLMYYLGPLISLFLALLY